MTSEDFQISEISKNEEKDDEFDVLNSAIKLITDYTNKAKNKKGFYYTETLKLINYEDIKDFFFCKSCNNSFLFFIESKDLINLETISYSCKCEKKIQQIIQIKDLDILKVNLNEIKNKLILNHVEINILYFVRDIVIAFVKVVLLEYIKMKI